MPPTELRESRQEQLTRQFYEWEIRGRGWQVWDEVVELEPAFRPFWGHWVAAVPGAVVDDGHVPTFLSRLVETLKALVSGNPKSSVGAEPQEEEDAEPSVFEDIGAIIELQIALPAETKITKDAAEQFLMTLGYVCRPIAFEIIGTCDAIIVQMACGARDRTRVREMLQAFFPEAVHTERTGFLESVCGHRSDQHCFVVDFGLSNEFMRPLRCFERYEPDPLAGPIGAMAELEEGEAAVLQILFSPAKHPWSESMMRAVTDGSGESFFEDDPELLKLAGRKIAKPLFAAVIRVAARAARRDRAGRIAEGVASSLRQFSDQPGNELIPLTNDAYDDHQHASDLVRRQSRRSGMLVNSDELVSLIHLPSVSVRSEKLKRHGTRTKRLPNQAYDHKLIVGENIHGGKTALVTLSPSHRARHTYLVGASGTGKSTLLLSMMVQDIKNGEGLAVLDPHGDLIDQVLGHIPEERLADVVLLDPSDAEYPIGFNVLSARTELERTLLASDLVSVFRRFSTSWGDQMNTVLANAIMVFLESRDGGTLSDLKRFLVEGAFRQQFLKTVDDTEIVYYWEKQFPLLKGMPQGPILTRLDTFLRPKLIRHMVSQKENRLDFSTIMSGRKIFLAKLAQGLVGEENSYLLGALLVSKINQAVMSRQVIPEAQRTPFYLYIDEFHNFITPSLAAILAGARKYGLGLILAHQELQQLWSRDNDVANAIVSNPCTRICFRLGDLDAKKLEGGFSFFKSHDLQNLAVGEAICRIERSESDFNLKTMPVPAVEPEIAARRRNAIVTLSRERYARRRALTEPSSLAPQEETLREQQPAEPKLEPRSSTPTPPSPEAPLPAIAPATPQHPMEPLIAGRGGAQHKYLQDLVKRWAESREYRVTVEKQILDGLGSVDVALERGECSIACEISITTSPEHELGNIQKCLAAGFTYVAVLATEKKTLRKITAAAKCLCAPELDRVKFFLPEELFSFLEAREAEMGTKDKTVRGYRVKVKLKSLTEEETAAKRQVITQTIVKSLRRLKDKKPG